jgi:hypoxanthine phosphoribosyltransferase
MSIARVRGLTLEVLFDAEAIAFRNTAMATEIAAAGYRDLLVVSILKGSFVFAADLLRALHRAGLAPEVEFMALSSYGAVTSSAGHVRLLRDIETDVGGRDVLLIDDILESGRTIAFAKQSMLARGARRVATAVLLEKPGKRARAVEAEHVGFLCPDQFVVGYGMDKGHAFRELPYVAVVSDPPATSQ